jgi:hypothetical protein
MQRQRCKRVPIQRHGAERNYRGLAFVLHMFANVGFESSCARPPQRHDHHVMQGGHVMQGARKEALLRLGVGRFR